MSAKRPLYAPHVAPLRPPCAPNVRPFEVPWHVPNQRRITFACTLTVTGPYGLTGCLLCESQARRTPLTGPATRRAGGAHAFLRAVVLCNV